MNCSIASRRKGLAPWLGALAMAALAGPLAAQVAPPSATGHTYEVVHEFMGKPQGRMPYSGVIEGLDGQLYGTTAYGGKHNLGVAYKLSAAGDFEVLDSFKYANGANPEAELVQADDGPLYGTTPLGGANMTGTVFRLSPTGERSVVYSFGPEGDGNTDGTLPRGLAQGPDGAFYGVTRTGGRLGAGTAFRITPTGEFTLLHEFGDIADVARPASALVLGPDDQFYGVSDQGPNDYGTVFRMSLTGEVSILHAFDGTAGRLTDIAVGPSGDIFGATSAGGEFNLGTVYRLAPDGSMTVIHSFAGTDGLFPEGAVTLTAQGRLYGTTPFGGPNYQEGHPVHGVVYRLQPDGRDFHVVHSFKGGYQDGARPAGRLLQASDGRIYGTTTGGGAGRNGIVFTITPK